MSLETENPIFNQAQVWFYASDTVSSSKFPFNSKLGFIDWIAHFSLLFPMTLAFFQPCPATGSPKILALDNLQHGVFSVLLKILLDWITSLYHLDMLNPKDLRQRFIWDARL